MKFIETLKNLTAEAKEAELNEQRAALDEHWNKLIIPTLTEAAKNGRHNFSLCWMKDYCSFSYEMIRNKFLVEGFKVNCGMCSEKRVEFVVSWN